MSVALRSVDYKADARPGRTVSPGAGSALRAEDFPAVEEFLHLLARAVRQFHTYPPTSPLCADAIAACHKVYATLERRDGVTVRVTPTELIVDEISVGTGTVIELELVRRLHKARIASVAFDRSASIRDFSRFCADIIASEGLTKAELSLAELLTDHGVETIVPQEAQRREVLDVGAPAPSVCTLVENERRRRESESAGNGQPVNHLYQPDKGWVRLDPAAQFDVVSLTDLAVIVNDPGEIATILLRLTDDDDGGDGAKGTALERKFTDVTTLFSSLDPRLGRVMFGKLARAVLDLEPERRAALLQKTILPGLLDGRPDGRVLGDFPDPDLAESLCLLLELETAAPEVLTAALNRLDLSDERRETVVPLINERLRQQQAAAGRAEDAGLDRHARRLIKVKDAPGRDFTEFAAFDLSMDEQVASALGGVRDSIRATDLPTTQLQCLRSLVRLEPNVTDVAAFLQRSLVILAALERAARWHDLAAQASGYRQLAAELRARRPDVGDAIDHAMAAFCTAERALAVATLHERDGAGREAAGALIEAFGPAVVPACMGLLDDPARQSPNRSLASLMCAHAALLAPAIARELARCGIAARRVGVKALGFAGAGYETAVAERIVDSDEPLVREALRALARMGTAQAASIVAKQLQNASTRTRAAAAEALWHFPPARASALVRELLSNHDFVLQNSATVTHLLDRAAKAGIEGLDPVLAELEPLRFRFWKPGLVRLAQKARELRAR